MTPVGKIAAAALLTVALAACQQDQQRPVTTASAAAAAEAAPPFPAAGVPAYQPPPFPDIRAGQRPDPSSDEAGLWLMSDRIEEKSRLSGDRITDPALNSYVRDVVCRLAGPHCSDIRVYIGRVPHFNASMMPNGMMMVWSGFLLRARNEAQLAAVLGHEIGHYLRRHSIQRWRDTMNTAGFLTFFSMGMAVVGIPGIADIAGIMARGSLASFSRDNEREADAIGLQRIADAGYDPREAAKVWENLIEEKKRAEADDNFNIFLSSHPRSEEREEYLAEQAKAIIAKTGRTGLLGTEKYQEVIAPLRFAMLQDEVRLRDPKRNLAVIDMLIEDGPGLGELHYFRGEVYRLRDNADEKDREAALAEYEKAAAFADCPPELYRALGILNVRMGRNAEAATALERYLKLRPDSPDAAFLRNYIKPVS